MATPDISRQLFQPEKRYIGAFMQQGRVVTDEDLNEHRRLRAEDERHTFRDIICAKGSPNHGFRIALGVNLAGYNFTIEDGSFYIGGLRFEALANQPETFLTQRDWLQIDVDHTLLPQVPTAADLTGPSGQRLDRHDLVYLHGWEQCVSAVEDRELIEVAFGGPDTSVYERRHRRIEVLPGVAGECTAAFEELIDQLTEGGHAFDSENCELISGGRLTVGFSGGPPSDDLCQPPVLQGYLGAENQAIRVQLTAPNRFIWGFDNATPLYRVQITQEMGLNVIRFLTLPRDEFAQPVSGQAVEILPWGAFLPNQEKAAEWQGHLTTVATGFDPGTGRITIETPIPQAWLDWLNEPAHAGFLNDRDEPAAQRYFYLRVWTGGSGLAAQADFPFVPNTPVPLAGTGLQVTFSDAGIPGSFWVIAARPNTPDEVVPWNLTTQAPAFGRRQFYAPLALIRWSIDPVNNAVLGSAIDCRSRFRPLCELKGCCTIIVGDGLTSHGEFTLIQDAVNALPPVGGEICVLRGRYQEHIRLVNRSNIKIRGCGRDTRIIAQNDTPVIEIVDSQRIEITDLAIEAPAAPGIRCHSTTPDAFVENIAFTRLSILSRDHNSVAVFRGRSVTYAHNEVRVLELTALLPDEGTVGRQSAVFLHGEDILIEGNRILAEGIRAAVRGYGGLHIGGGSARVEIRRNLIRGGNNNGITLGHTILRPVESPQAVDDFAIGVFAFIRLGIFIDPHGCVVIDPFPPRPADGEGTVLEAGPALHDVGIVDNRIEDMGMSGIAVDRFFDLEENPDVITVARLTIEQNRITGCMLLEIGTLPFPLRDITGFGGIALADIDEYLVIRENTVSNNGQSSLDPICGIFVLHGEGIAIDGNRILHNGMPDDKREQLPRPGRRGGIVLALARARTMQIAPFGTRFPGRRQDGVPAARVHDNIVVALQGRALEILALGPVSVEANQLTAKGSNFLNQIPLPENSGSFTSKTPSAAASVPLTNRKATSNPFFAFLDVLGGAVVSIFNLGVSNEIYLQLFGFSGLFLLDDLPVDEVTEDEDDPRFFVGGNILFDDNQVVLDAFGQAVTFTLSSVFLGCLDDVSMSANQCDCDLLLDFVLTNALTLGWSQRMADNRFKEGVRNALLSGASLALLNTTTDNQGTHCFFPVGATSVSHIAGNRSLVQLGGRNTCPRNDLNEPD
jgi:hypothetical protein